MSAHAWKAEVRGLCPKCGKPYYHSKSSWIASVYAPATARRLYFHTTKTDPKPRACTVIVDSKKEADEARNKISSK